MRMLVVEDGARSIEELRELFHPDGHDADSASVFSEALQLIHAIRYDLVVIDVDVTKGRASELVDSIRRSGNNVPLMVLAADESDPRVVECLEAGADEWVRKPITASALLKHVRASQRRVLADREDLLVAGVLSLSRSRQSVVSGQELIPLTAKEYAVLEMLMERPDVLIPRGEILLRVWGLHNDTGTGVLDVALHRVRRKIAAVCGGMEIVGIRGQGVVLVTQAGEKRAQFLKSS